MRYLIRAIFWLLRDVLRREELIIAILHDGDLIIHFRGGAGLRDVLQTTADIFKAANDREAIVSHCGDRWRLEVLKES